VTGDFTGLRTNGENTRRIEAVERAARTGIVRFGVAGSPIHEIELGIVGPRSPRRAAALRPRVAVFGPRLGTRLSRSRNRVTAPQLRARVRIPAVENPARGELAARHS